MMLSRTMHVLSVSFLVAGAAVAQQATPAAPAGSTGLCKDGSFTTNATKSGACSGHKGVKTWFAATAAVAKPTAPAVTAPMAAAPVAAKPVAATPKPAAMPMAAAPATAPATAAPAPAVAPVRAPSVAAAGGGAGQVWVNASSKVYHCQGSRYYGKTKAGTYMTEDAAKSAGNHADHGKACS